MAVAGGRVWVADTYNHKIKSIRMSSGETITEAGGPHAQGAAALCEPGGITRAGGYLLIADTGNHRLAVLRVRDGALRELPVL